MELGIGVAEQERKAKGDVARERNDLHSTRDSGGELRRSVTVRRGKIVTVHAHIVMRPFNFSTDNAFPRNF